MKPVLREMCLFVVLMTGFAGPVPAQQHQEKMLSGAPGAVYTAVGEGTGSCENWTASRRTHKAFDIEQWILGFLAGVGFDAVDGTDPLKLLGSDAIFVWIDNYCLAHPVERITSAAAAFVSRGSHPVLTLH